MIDVLIPSRAAEKLERSVGSLRTLATFPHRVRVHVAADDDDDATIAVAEELGTVVHTFDSRPGYAGLHVYYQRMAASCSGDWLLVWNDDATMLTARWDEILGELPAQVLVADVQQPFSPSLCCFPAVRLGAVAALGRFCTDNPHVDTFWQDVGRATGSIVAVPIHAGHDSPINAGHNHGFYDAAHQAELLACTETIRRYHDALGESHRQG